MLKQWKSNSEQMIMSLNLPNQSKLLQLSIFSSFHYFSSDSPAWFYFFLNYSGYFSVWWIDVCFYCSGSAISRGIRTTNFHFDYLLKFLYSQLPQKSLPDEPNTHMIYMILVRFDNRKEELLTKLWIYIAFIFEHTYGLRKTILMDRYSRM